MARNLPDSVWYATPRSLRKRKPLSVTLSSEARERLESMAEGAGLTLSGVVEALALHPKADAVVAAKKKASGA